VIYDHNTDLFLAPLPAIAGTCKGSCLLVGPAPCAIEDIERAPKTDAVMAVSGGMTVLRKLGVHADHWFSCHPEDFALWAPEGWENVLTHAKQGATGADHLWPINGRFAITSGPSAAVVAVALGYEPVILAGLPADGSGHHDIAGPGASTYTDETRWRQLDAMFFRGRVRSLSGNTGHWLGHFDPSTLVARSKPSHAGDETTWKAIKPPRPRRPRERRATA
jgi:hypothetical protein